ncbi:hypothetical protein OE88DRAFT_1649161 [Heliocybe sulcata]|uniref:Uncharacterized protein n=1 Tax=Heliocybe sulcata TaxID=5364 RepID=A0A5C3ML70_9AGAM|nr:hypothetical protein OE88DRAFT_1649161 [Heliocybe sulcata]
MSSLARGRPGKSSSIQFCSSGEGIFRTGHARVTAPCHSSINGQQPHWATLFRQSKELGFYVDWHALTPDAYNQAAPIRLPVAGNGIQDLRLWALIKCMKDFGLWARRDNRCHCKETASELVTRAANTEKEDLTDLRWGAPRKVRAGLETNHSRWLVGGQWVKIGAPLIV